MSKTIGGWFSMIFGLKLWNIHCILCQVRFSEATPVAPWRVEGGTAQRPKPSRSTERGRRTSSHKYPGCLSQYKDSNLNLRCVFLSKSLQKLPETLHKNSAKLQRAKSQISQVIRVSLSLPTRNCPTAAPTAPVPSMMPATVETARWPCSRGCFPRSTETAEVKASAGPPWRMPQQKIAHLMTSDWCVSVHGGWGNHFWCWLLKWWEIGLILKIAETHVWKYLLLIAHFGRKMMICGPESIKWMGKLHGEPWFHPRPYDLRMGQTWWNLMVTLQQ